jgi:dUTP pyrophosphatase
MIEIKYKLVHPNAKVPTKAHDKGDSCFDLYASQDTTIYIACAGLVQTGLIMEIPEGWSGWIWDRSGLALKGDVSTRGGVIDANYRDPIGVILRNEGYEIAEIKTGDRIAQIDFRPVYDVQFKEVEKTSETSRNGGFGSSGQ